MSTDPRIWPDTEARFQPLQIEAVLAMPMSSMTPVNIDALLADRYALAHRYPPPAINTHIPPAPFKWNPLGFHHASEAHYQVQGYSMKHFTKRPPDLRSVSLLTDTKKLNITTGTFRPYYMPMRLYYPVAGTLTWWVVGDPDAIAFLLHAAPGVGGKRSQGEGRVLEWRITGMDEDWSITRPDPETGTQIPTRPIPRDMAPTGWASLRMTRRTYPYSWNTDRELLAVPETAEERR